MHWTMHVVIHSWYHWDFEVVPGENLGSLINENVSLIVILYDVVFHLIKINVRSPTINVDNGQKKVISGKHQPSKLLLQMFGTPRNIRSLALLFVLPYLMQSVINMSELIPKPLYYLLGFLLCTLLMFFHG